MKKYLFIFLLLITLNGGASISVSAYSTTPTLAVRQDKYYRTELYFGRSIPSGGMVSDEDWEKFLAEVVTPRFPSGFTILDAQGQYREDDGKVVKELTKVLVIFYPAKTRTADRRKIDEIRSAYVKQFKQRSVLRLDFPSTVCVTF